MGQTVRTSISIQRVVLERATGLARSLAISRNELFEMALTNLFWHYQEQFEADAHSGVIDRVSNSAKQGNHERLRINQGDIYWARSEEASPDILHPHVVIQDDVLNYSRIHTVVVCGLTSNMRRANLPGNVLLTEGEGNLPRPSVVEVSKVSAVDKAYLGEYIGSLDPQRIDQVLAGMRLLQRSFFT